VKRLVLLFAVGCGEQLAVTDLEQSTTVCGVGPTVKGIDVSYYQGSIDWAKVAGDGVAYAFIRVSDGTGTIDPQFPTYWANSRANGILHGAYQFFRPNEDPIAQADLLLSKMGQLQPDDLPPVIDVEATGGLAPAAVASAVKTWVDHVAAAIGKPPIIYTGYYFWRDSVGGPDDTTSPLWHAQYTTAACPNIADPWTTWAFWQYTSTGTVAGISGGMDVDRFNGDMTALMGMTMGGGTTMPCGTIDAAGGEVDDADPCFKAGGPLQYIRSATDAGEHGSLKWTHTTNSATEANFGEWTLNLAAAGRYRVEVYTAAAYAQSKRALYKVQAGGTEMDVLVDQTAVDGWQSLGDFDFVEGSGQYVHLGDNTGEPSADNIQLVFDAVRLTPSGSGSGSGSGSDGSGSDMGGDDTSNGAHAGCSAGGGAGALALMALVGVGRRRRASR
jgi:GH25 family lysozyme M1 (1,4-beta-N-acetylmuramidase)